MFYLIAPEIDLTRRIDWFKREIPLLKCDFLLVESKKGGAEIQKAGIQTPYELYNEHHTSKDEDQIIKRLKTQTGGFISDGGAPCVGDPGSRLIRSCHQRGIPVKTHGVHSYILAGLLLSGCDANRFTFLGYPPRSQKERSLFIQNLFNQGSDSNSPKTYVLMDTPYRIHHVIRDIAQHKSSQKFWMSISTEIGLASEQTIAGNHTFWLKNIDGLVKRIGAKPLCIVTLEI